MTIPISRAAIPDSALTDLETLAVWACSTLEFMANGRRYQEAEGLNVFQFDKSLFRSYTEQNIASFRINVQLQPNFTSNQYPSLWAAVQPELDGTIPASYLQGS
ncbi:hypothetical protein [Adonisia turfae]|uniref:Uncharacterized protein n=1 Tax=Adonisia turfae CCMR0081 TaxID=2292702 RepID=A0A6M0RD56_9CYAN|nr:hypothetical protein [Adonisia turfae]NEZ54239.1 hypothetical protein [Adonisia turfae CCMR0081]